MARAAVTALLALAGLFSACGRHLRRARQDRGRVTHWDRNIAHVQVTDLRESNLEVRILVTAKNSPKTFDLRCEVREKLIAFLQTN